MVVPPVAVITASRHRTGQHPSPNNGGIDGDTALVSRVGERPWDELLALAALATLALLAGCAAAVRPAASGGAPAPAAGANAVIRAGAPLFTLVNVCDTGPGRRPETLAFFDRIIALQRGLPGFVSASVHVGRNDTTLTNYAHWRQTADFAAMLDTSAAGRLIRGPSPTPLRCRYVIYDVRSVTAGAGS